MADPLQKLISNINIVNLLGKIDRDNTQWSGYDKASEWANIAGEEGVKIRTSPDWMSNKRPFTLGNNIFIPEGYTEKWMDEYPSLAEEGILNYIIPEEMPHVAQYREEGVLGFLGKHLIDLLKHGANEATYDVMGTHESFHTQDPEERTRLMSAFDK